MREQPICRCQNGWKQRTSIGFALRPHPSSTCHKDFQNCCSSSPGCVKKSQFFTWRGKADRGSSCPAGGAVVDKKGVGASRHGVLTHSENSSPTNYHQFPPTSLIPFVLGRWQSLQSWFWSIPGLGCGGLWPVEGKQGTVRNLVLTLVVKSIDLSF